MSALPILSYAQLVKHDRILSFEDKNVPAFISSVNSKLSVSPLHYKDGQSSLSWKFNSGGELIISKNLHFEDKDPTGEDTYLSTFVVWIYNEEPAEAHIEFEFYKDGKKCTSFPFGINFKGWRAAWVSYDRDMQGKPEEGMNEIRIKAPSGLNGELFFDQLVTAAKADHRHHTPDVQVPFVNKETDNHWLVLLKNSQIQPDMALEELTDIQKEDMKILENRLYELIYSPSVLSENEVEAIRKAYDFYRIKYTNGNVSGLPVFFGRAHEIFERIVPDWKDIYGRNQMELGKYFTLMNRIAVAYNNAIDKKDKDALRNMFLAMYDHAADQGVAYGSGLGNITHYGYSFRGLYTACFLMKDVLASTGRLSDAEKTLLWYAMTNEIFIKPEKYGIDMDAFNTTTTGRICSILMMEDSPEKVRYIKSFRRWIDNGCMPSEGLDGSFKMDGGAFHHRNNYPAYAVGGLSGATNMIYLLSRTSFAVSPEAHQTVKNVLSVMRFYCNKTHFPLSMSGRHPDGRGELIPVQYGRLAVAGTPDGKEEIDREMGAQYLRLISNPVNSEKPEYMPESQTKIEQDLAKRIMTKGIAPENDPAGNLSLGYGCVSVQRRNNWSAVVRGHSRYLWAAEHYLGANLYGRYLAHGSMQIFTGNNGETVTPFSSGWVQDGFDWGRIPGTTAIHLPVEQLKANVLNVDVYSGFEEMLYSDEAFAGGLSHGGKNGVFGMKLHEHDKYNGSHRARKSYHFFDGRIVCLGSDIENINRDYNTETTVFQLAVTDDKALGYWNTYSGKKDFWIDHLKTGYYIPKKKENSLNFEKNFPQHSRKQNTGEETSGNWVALTVNHGKAPKGQSYEYMVVPQTNENEMQNISKKVPYKVLQKDRNAHIVKDIACNTTSYVLFETPLSLPDGVVQKADTSCLIMLEETDRTLNLTVCNPDLVLYRGASDELFDENGKRIERSIYSRPWISNKSKEIPVTITLRGKWNVKETDNCKIISSNNGQTVLRFDCKDGASFGVELYK
ncbi:chondroitinase [Dysgonomonas sp. OttesenSCG-928-M03]|nr:chondroitinase [Dysgonomonas sp. OttesenSCG-928-M03]